MLIESSRARSRASFPSRPRSSSSWPSILVPPRRSASTCLCCSSRAPTRLSNEKGRVHNETPRDYQELTKRALSFVNEIHSKWSETNAFGLAWLDPLYADEVNFYGKLISRAEVLTEKRLFTERWPERNYRIQPNSMN